MDWFEFLFFFLLSGGLLATLKLNFFISFVGAEHKKSYYAGFLAFCYATALINQLSQANWFSAIFNLLFILWLGYYMQKVSLSNAVLASILMECVTLLAFGIINSVTGILAPIIIPINFKFGIYLGTGSLILSLLLIYLSFQLILRKFHVDKSAMKQYFTIFFLSVLFVLLVCGYISNFFYGTEIIMESSGVIQPGVNHWAVLAIQCVVGSLLVITLYACQKISKGFAAQTRLALLEQEISTQQDYLQEARSRYEQTQAFRHDIKNHLSVLNGLLEHGETQSAKSYLEKLDAISEALSFPCKTGNTVVDTLLGAKLSAARQKGIQIECTVQIPPSCSVDDLDFCVLFSNAVDNAVRACSRQEAGTKYIRISGKEKGDFFMVEIENSCSDTGSYQKGIGLSNIEAVAEKYHGAVTSENSGNSFRLNVLLIISRSLSDISVSSR